VQSLAEQKHALKISEHTLIIMCNNKAGYNWYSKMPKRTFTAQHSGKFGGPGQTLTWWLSWFHVLTLWLWGPGHPPEKIWNLRSQKWPTPAFWKSSWQLYLCIFHCNSLFGPPLTGIPGQIAPLWAALTAPAVFTNFTTNFFFVQRHGWMMTHECITQND
jgi:hypothetical protein